MRDETRDEKTSSAPDNKKLPLGVRRRTELLQFEIGVRYGEIQKEIAELGQIIPKLHLHHRDTSAILISHSSSPLELAALPHGEDDGEAQNVYK